MFWNKKAGLSRDYSKPTGTSWDRIPSADLCDPKFDHTGTPWDGISDELLETCADAEERRLKPAHEAGELPHSMIVDGHIVGDIGVESYEGAGQAWTQRQSSVQMQRLTALALRTKQHQVSNGQLPVLTDEEKARWQKELDKCRHVRGRVPSHYREHLLSLESEIALAAACDKKLKMVFGKTFPDVVSFEIGHAGEFYHVSISKNKLAKTLLNTAPEKRQPTLTKFFGDLYDGGIDRKQGGLRSVNREEFIQEYTKYPPSELSCGATEGSYNGFEYRHISKKSLIEIAEAMNVLFRKKGVGELDLEPFKKEVAAEQRVREEGQLIRQSRGR